MNRKIAKDARLILSSPKEEKLPLYGDCIYRGEGYRKGGVEVGPWTHASIRIHHEYLSETKDVPNWFVIVGPI